MSALLHEPGTSPRACGHAKQDLLGSEGRATFYRCADCGSVLIVEDGNRWILHRAILP